MGFFIFVKTITMKKHIFAFFLFTAAIFAQIGETNTQILQELSVKFNSDFIARQARISNFLNSNPNFSLRTESNGVLKEIYDVDSNGLVTYLKTSNAGSAQTAKATSLYAGGALGLNIQGQGMYGYVWDGGSARTSHVDFPNSKVTNMDGGTNNNHATHVMGTIVGNGPSANRKGLAFDASGLSYDWSNDYSEMSAAAASEAMMVSNHSYGITAGTEWIFGAYTSLARDFDLIASAAPYYLAVTAAGNDRDDFSDSTIGPFISQNGGYGLIFGMQTAKNFLVVGAVNQVSNYVNPNSVTMSSFSSWGPTDDGRIKPDLVAKGVGVTSATAASNTSSDTYQGTSMASPAVAGVALLIQQYFNQSFDQYLRASTLKGLLMHTTSEAGANLGPDYEFGWGLVNAEQAATLIFQKDSQSAIIDELTLTNNTTYTRTINCTDSNPLMVSISWTDPASPSVNNGQLDPTTSYLVNDLDIRLTKDGVTYFPWTLDPLNPFMGAVRTSDNNKDNFEKIQIDNPSGTYTLTVTHKGSLTGGSQKFALIASNTNGIMLSNDAFNTLSFTVYPNPANDKVFIGSTEASLFNNSTYQIINTLGSVISQGLVLENNAIDVSSLSNGVYFIKISNSDNSTIKKFIKK